MSSRAASISVAMSASLNWIAWKSAIRLPNWRALERVGAGRVVGSLGDPDRLRGDPDPAAVERLHRDREAAVLLVQEPVAPDATRRRRGCRRSTTS